MSRPSLILMLLAGLALPPVLAVRAAPVGDGPRLVVHAPWTDGAALVARAGGMVVGPRDAPMGILAARGTADGFDARLRAAGAWAVIDGSVLARLCGVKADS